ncbi:hypothetical protein GY45DRAFT_1412186 [Cubamyces sp. BRFM 1775]|nr:hypothetical protein GY45DRAFT_1412186 [Cubamyces sp. BRFM 1775]
MLLSLNDDVSNLLLSAVALTKSLKTLSLTCWRMRLLCLPFLFKECTLRSYVPIQPAMFFPRTVWPYISILHFFDNCPDQFVEVNSSDDRPEEYLKYTSDLLFCGIYSVDYLKTALTNMPQLHTVTLHFPFQTNHGLPWSVLEHILTLPNIRNVAVTSHRFVPSLTPSENLTLDGRFMSLTSFQHTLSDYRHRREGMYLSEERALTVLLSAIRHSLEQLTPSTECGPLQWISDQPDWPRLRELRLRGEHPTIIDQSLPFISMFSNMPRLYVLS